MKICKLKIKGLAIISVLSITITAIVATTLLTGIGATSATVDIALVTVGIQGVTSVIKSHITDNPGKEDKKGGTNEKL